MNPRSPQYANTTQQFADQPDLIDRIANALPEELRADYYREMAHCRSLPESDEMLRILRAMQFLSVLIEQAPTRLANEQEQLARVLSGAIASLQATHQSGVAYQKQLEARLSKLPEEIAQGISADVIAARVSEHLRQQIQETGLPGLADAIAVQAAGLRKTGKELSVALDEFSSPRHGAVPLLNKELASMKTNLGNAADHIQVQMNGLGKELWRSMAVVSAGTLAVGFIGGILYHQWITSPVEPPAASTPQVQVAPSPGPTLRKSLPQRSPPTKAP
jgi:hypothetical protein